MLSFILLETKYSIEKSYKSAGFHCSLKNSKLGNSETKIYVPPKIVFLRYADSIIFNSFNLGNLYELAFES